MASRLPSQQELQQLLNLGISRAHATKGLQTQNFSVSQAIDWCLKNPESIDVSDNLVQSLRAIGFSEAHARHALLLNGNSLERAIDWCQTNPEQKSSDGDAEGKKGAANDGHGDNAARVTSSSSSPFSRFVFSLLFSLFHLRD
mmetsp:Transcript_32471/g.79075  ORF Transcript_32471/g.79075 Transcript_32471/m.79075 type:complete len:143 (-) Transcript_32471:213-641(-)